MKLQLVQKEQQIRELKKKLEQGRKEIEKKWKEIEKKCRKEIEKKCEEKWLEHYNKAALAASTLCNVTGLGGDDAMKELQAKFRFCGAVRVWRCESEDIAPSRTNKNLKILQWEDKYWLGDHEGQPEFPDCVAAIHRQEKEITLYQLCGDLQGENQSYINALVTIKSDISSLPPMSATCVQWLNFLEKRDRKFYYSRSNPLKRIRGKTALVSKFIDDLNKLKNGKDVDTDSSCSSDDDDDAVYVNKKRATKRRKVKK